MIRSAGDIINPEPGFPLFELERSLPQVVEVADRVRQGGADGTYTAAPLKARSHARLRALRYKQKHSVSKKGQNDIGRPRTAKDTVGRGGSRREEDGRPTKVLVCVFVVIPPRGTQRFRRSWIRRSRSARTETHSARASAKLNKCAPERAMVTKSTPRGIQAESRRNTSRISRLHRARITAFPTCFEAVIPRRTGASEAGPGARIQTKCVAVTR